MNIRHLFLATMLIVANGIFAEELQNPTASYLSDCKNIPDYAPYRSSSNSALYEEDYQIPEEYLPALDVDYADSTLTMTWYNITGNCVLSKIDASMTRSETNVLNFKLEHILP